MQRLPNNCRAGNISVFPKNWKTKRANINLSWYIKYRFYDDNLNQSKQVVIKGMNVYSTLKEKQDATESLLEEELYEIKSKGFNKITGLYAVVSTDEITKDTLLLDAIDYSFRKIDVEPNTRTDIRSTLKFIKQGIIALQYNRLTLGEVRKKHIITVMEKTGELKKLEHAKRKAVGEKMRHEPWSRNTYNAYRKNLGIIFSYFEYLEITDTNIVHTIDRAKTTKKIRDTLTDEQFAIINKDLFNNHYSFWRLMVIFYHSGSRETEILKVRKMDVDLIKQRFKITVKKGQGDNEEEWRVIKDSILHLWQELCQNAHRTQYLLSEFLEPGNNSISPKQISRRWKRHVKDVWGITADFYSLKHSHTTEMMDFLISEKEALNEVANLNGHTSSKMVATVYDVKGVQRKEKKVLKMPNKFG